MSMLEAEKLSKVYKSGTFGGGLKPALRQVSFGIDKGEVVSLIGESGSGKSTLGKMVLRLIPASGGRLLFEGTDVSTLKGRDLHDYYRHVQGVFQDPFSSYNPLYKADRVLELVRQEYFAELSQGDWDAKVAMALETVSLNPADVLNKFPHQLSGGQQQRLLVARALLLEVKLLIADEIISMLDASTRVDVLNLLVSLKKRGLARPVHHPRPLARQLHKRQYDNLALGCCCRDGRHRESLWQPAALLHPPPAYGRAAAAPQVAGGR